MSKILTFETERLLIRPADLTDGEFIYELLNSPKWLKNIGNRNINSPDDAIAYIKSKMLPQLKKLGYSNNTVIRKSDNKKIGTCGLYNRDNLEGVDIGFAFLPQYEGLGYAFEASSRIMKAAKEDFNLNGLKGITLPSNLASQKLLEKLGLTYIKDIQLIDDETLMLFEIKF